jgi:hydrogenase nickel incorporation protein HypB
MDFRVIELKQSVFADNDKDAQKLREQLNAQSVFMVNVMSSPGAGKTTTLRRTINALKDELRIAVMEADIDSDVDARAVAETGVKVIQLHTGGMCHLDADMARQGLEALGVFSSEELNLVILENIGNLVCPAEFDVGAHLNVMLLSVPEGDDKALKYPLMFKKCDVLLINKIDTLPMFDFDTGLCVERARALNPGIKVFPISAKTGEGIGEWTDFLREEAGVYAGL